MKQDKKQLAEALEDMISEMDAMEDQDCAEYRQLFFRKYRIEREVRQHWY